MSLSSTDSPLIKIASANFFPPFCLSTTTICKPLLFSDATSSNSLSINPELKGMSTRSAAFPSSMKIAGLHSNANGGPAFVGQVFSMCDISGTGLMSVSSHFDIPFLSKRTPEWMKNMFSVFTKSASNGPVFRFFMDLGDAVSYVKRLNIPTGVVGACRLDLAYEHFKEKPHMFKFVPNEKQVAHSACLLCCFSFLWKYLAISLLLCRYTPYFFDKNMLDNILEESVDQHFNSLIQTRHMQRRRDVVDDNLTSEVVEDNGDSLFEPPEVQEVLDEMGYPGVPLSVISKAAEVQLLYAVDKVLLGNRWLRKATGIQPKFPYMVDSFEKRSAASFMKAAELTNTAGCKEVGYDKDEYVNDSAERRLQGSTQGGQKQQIQNDDFRLPFGDWLANLQSFQQKSDTQIEADTSLTDARDDYINQQLPLSPLLPKITMVGISTGEAGQMSKANLKKTMEDLTKELEQPSENGRSSSGGPRNSNRDPLFVANVGI
ncbi:hypothetical protein IFM89_019278 [Coptis chinensis]|uniref:Tic22-like family protein n=1 Tax=Coptis chinensis TaxID=261450 RepID=A0A835LIJ5_9MAGN|nr:hypothetical protein IFM89_019278 [Coptis chinensis]